MAWTCASSDFISIHAPAKGATFIFAKSRRGFSISIHAPAKGATGTEFTQIKKEKDFNPRSREGSDYIDQSAGNGFNEFQSTLPRRERHKSLDATILHI